MKKLILTFFFAFMAVSGYSQVALHIFNENSRLFLFRPDGSKLIIPRGYSVLESATNQVSFVMDDAGVQLPTQLTFESGKPSYFLFSNLYSRGYRGLSVRQSRQVREVNEREFFLTLLLNKTRAVPQVVKY